MCIFPCLSYRAPQDMASCPPLLRYSITLGLMKKEDPWTHLVFFWHKIIIYVQVLSSQHSPPPIAENFLFFFFARNMTLFVELTDWEDGRLAPQNNHLLQKNFWYHCPIGPGICDQSWPVQWRELILIYVCVCFLIEISLTYNIKLVSSVQNNSIFFIYHTLHS